MGQMIVDSRWFLLATDRNNEDNKAVLLGRETEQFETNECGQTVGCRTYTLYSTVVL